MKCLKIPLHMTFFQHILHNKHVVQNYTEMDANDPELILFQQAIISAIFEHYIHIYSHLVTKEKWRWIMHITD